MTVLGQIALFPLSEGRHEITEIPVAVLAKTAVDASATSTVDEKSVFSASVSGYLLGSNNRFQLQLWGHATNNTGSARTLTIRAKFGGTTIHTMDVAISSTGEWPLDLTWNFMGDGATNAQISHLSVVWNSQITHTYGTATVATTTADQAVAVTVQWSNADADYGMHYGMLTRWT